jgi:hypothetical protein
VEPVGAVAMAGELPAPEAVELGDIGEDAVVSRVCVGGEGDDGGLDGAELLGDLEGIGGGVERPEAGEVGERVEAEEWG